MCIRDRASDRFDRQLQAYKEAGVKLDAANNSISAAKDSLNEATTAFNEVVDDANAAVQHLFETFEKFHAFTFKAKLSSDDLNKLSELQKQIVVGGTQLLEEHRNETKKILSSHFYNMANKMAQNEGCLLYTSIQGKVNHRGAYIEHGLLRYTRVDEKGNIHIVGYTFSGEFTGRCV